MYAPTVALSQRPREADASALRKSTLLWWSSHRAASCSVRNADPPATDACAKPDSGGVVVTRASLLTTPSQWRTRIVMRSANLAPSSTRAPRTTPTQLDGVDTSWVERSTKAAVGTEDRHESRAGGTPGGAPQLLCLASVGFYH